MIGFVEEERIRRWQTYVEALEEERRKIQVFQRELPLCLELITQAIESYRQQMRCDEETSSDVPVLEEFIPIRRSSTSEKEEEQREEEQHESSHHQNVDGDEENNQPEITSEKKANWLQSMQLWNQKPDSPDEVAKPRKPIVLETKKVRGAFHPFNREKRTPAIDPPPIPPPVTTAAASSTADTGGGGGGGSGGRSISGGDDKEGQSNRKARRCWSPELHRRFLHALQQLGGSHVATPKQIRELMKVDGLTNDEVKSHLQKYRLHTRRPSPPIPASSEGSHQTPQFILVGGIWVPPPQQYAVAPAAPAQPAAGTSASAAGGGGASIIYAPVASLPLGSQCNKNNSSNTNSGEGNHSNSDSPATSSSSLTITTSPQT